MSELSALSPHAAHYSPLSFVFSKHAELASDVISQREAAIADAKLSRLDGNAAVSVFYRPLGWDSEHFGASMYQLEFVGYRTETQSAVAAAVGALTAKLVAENGTYHIFAEVPSEDIAVLRALGLSGWSLIETRLTYYRDDVQAYEYPRRFSTRLATAADVAAIREIGATQRNAYDRFHADPFFSQQQADDFLGVFAANSVAGFADIVLVAESDSGVCAFLTAKDVDTPPGLAEIGPIARMVLSAVAPACKGAYVRLISEMSYLFKERGVRTAFMTTQSTNRQVIRVWEKLGYRFGRTTHVLSKSQMVQPA